MYIRIYNQSKRLLRLGRGLKIFRIANHCSNYFDISGTSRIIFYFEIDKDDGEYIRYYKELPIEEIKRLNLYVYFKRNRIILRQRDD